MTCIIAVKKEDIIYWGADSCAFNGNVRTEAEPKIFKVGNLVFGGSGNARMAQIVRHHLVPVKHEQWLSDIEYLVQAIVPQVRELTKEYGQLNDSVKEDGEQQGAAFILGYRGNIYELSRDFTVSTFSEDYTAIGSGDDFAFGSLHTASKRDGFNNPVKDIEAALAAAEFFNWGVRGPFRFYTQTEDTLEELKNK